jgi:outer membrane protein assembly factor BamD
MKNLFLIICLVLLFSCSQKSKEIVTKVEGDSLEAQMIEAYNSGVAALEQGDVLFASKKFNEAELLYPQSEWAPKSSLMASYAYFEQAYYSNSVSELKRFLKIYPKHQNLNYAYYLLAMNYYDSIVDEKKDLRPLIEAKKYFNIVIKQYPESDYALDGKYKLKLIDDMMAAKEIYIARHYIKKEKWIAAINRLKIILTDYDTTIYVEEALHRLVEVYYIIGLEEESKKYAKTLGYNYQSSEWYKESYRVFNKDYKVEKINKENEPKEKLLDKIKSFF